MPGERYRVSWELTERYEEVLTADEVREHFGVSPEEFAARVDRDFDESFLSVLGEFENDEVVRESWRVLRGIEGL